MSKRKASDSSKKMVQPKITEIFNSAKRDRAVTEKDKPIKKLKQEQVSEKSERGEERLDIVVNEEEESSVASTSTSVRQKSHASSHQNILDEIDETFEDQIDIDALIDESEIVPRDTSSPNVESEPEELPRDRVAKLTFHDEDYTPTDKLLHAFDLNYDFGPCIGLSRLERWERAHKLGLNPPIEVKNALTSEVIEQDSNLNNCVFYGRI